ncbi:MAG: tetratricopeptide repeat protein [Candidatus Riflebacteria bacterium]|nr:tetratricopeptide repeat protein [Candidatus Riflebacteria bacterium]
MDWTLIIIGIGILVLIGIIVLVLGAKDKGKDAATFTTPPAEEKKENITHKRFKQVLSGNDLQSDMKAEEEELLTKYTAGTGEGINEVEKLLEGDPNNVDLLDWLAFMYYSNNNVDKAIETYKRALAIKSDNENQHYYLANSYFKKSMTAEAKKEWNEVIRLKPNSKIAKNAQERIDYLASQGK